MSIEKVLTNDFVLHYDDETERLLIYPLEQGEKPEIPIALKVSMLSEIGAKEASKWVGETILLLIPAMRRKVFQLPD
ncbi:MAG: hypothetical protein ACRERU_16440 [Methylococcales bacterium]